MLNAFLSQFFVIVAEKEINFKVQLQCPQCGAPILLEEETLFFECEFCRVQSCISQKGFARYSFSPSEEMKECENLFYLPYWRFKGVRYTCLLKGVESKFLDLSRLAMRTKPKQVAVSLGFRSQALALKRISPKTKGVFLRPLDYKQTLSNLDKRLHPGNNNIYQENIGETLSLIYSPFCIKDGILFDGILNKPIGPCDVNEINIYNFDACQPGKDIFFIPGLCPSCGWDLEGNSDSLVLICRNCETLWRSHKKKLVKIKFSCEKPVNEKDVLLPFWKIDTDFSHLTLTSYTDLINFANLPQIPKKEIGKQLLSFWAPAFKIRPKIFLRLIKQLAILQPKDHQKKQFARHQLSSVNLPSSEAVESIKITLAALMKPASQYLPLLSEIKTTPTAIKLIYLPFESNSHDLYHSQLGVSINKNSLKLSSNL